MLKKTAIIIILGFFLCCVGIYAVSSSSSINWASIGWVQNYIGSLNLNSTYYINYSSNMSNVAYMNQTNGGNFNISNNMYVDDNLTINGSSIVYNANIKTLIFNVSEIDLQTNHSGLNGSSFYRIKTYNSGASGSDLTNIFNLSFFMGSVNKSYVSMLIGDKLTTGNARVYFPSKIRVDNGIGIDSEPDNSYRFGINIVTDDANSAKSLLYLYQGTVQNNEITTGIYPETQLIMVNFDNISTHNRRVLHMSLLDGQKRKNGGSSNVTYITFGNNGGIFQTVNGTNEWNGIVIVPRSSANYTDDVRSNYTFSDIKLQACTPDQSNISVFRCYSIDAYAPSRMNTNVKAYFGKEQQSSIMYDGTNMIFNSNETTVGNASQGLAWFSANISAHDYITRTSVYDKSKGSALDKIKDADTLENRGVIDHSKFYGYTTYKVTDYSKPVPVKHEELNGNETIRWTETTYPYTTIEEGVDLGKEIDVQRQAIYELKTELCTYNDKYSWC
jgi:hypothetical protein